MPHRGDVWSNIGLALMDIVRNSDSLGAKVCRVVVVPAVAFGAALLPALRFSVCCPPCTALLLALRLAAAHTECGWLTPPLPKALAMLREARAAFELGGWLRNKKSEEFLRDCEKELRARYPRKCMAYVPAALWGAVLHLSARALVAGHAEPSFSFFRLTAPLPPAQERLCAVQGRGQGAQAHQGQQAH